MRVNQILPLMKSLLVLVIGLMGLAACEKDEPVEPKQVPAKDLSDQSKCLFLLGDINEGMVFSNPQRYDRLVDSINFETNPFPCEPADLRKGWDFEQYDYLVYHANVGGCSAEFNSSLQKSRDTLRMTVEARGFGICATLIGSTEVFRIPASLKFDAVLFKTEEFKNE